MKTSFDGLQEALARNEPGAEDRLQVTAAELYAVMGNEISFPYYELVLIAAEHAQRRGARTRAEALLRRAIVIAGHLGEDPLDARSRLQASAAWPPTPAALSSDRIVIAIDSDCRLFSWRPAHISFEPSSPRPYRWYLLAPAHWRQHLAAQAAATIEIVFARCNARLAAQEPNDANYIGVQPTSIHEMSAEDVLNEAWQVRGTAWSNERAFVAEDHGVYFPSGPNDFVPMAHLAFVTVGKMDSEASIDGLRKVGFSGEIIERQRNPVKELAEALAHYVRGQA